MIVTSRREALMLLAGAAASTVGTGALAQTAPKVAFVLNGAPGPVGWNFEHARGIEMAEATFGSTVQIDSFYNVNEWTQDPDDGMMAMLWDTYDLVFACSFGYGQSLLQLAFANPNTRFEHCGGYVRADNISTYSARWYEGRVIQGMMAGAMSKTNRVGYLGSFPIPQVIRGINAAFLAARSINPQIEFDVSWVNTWFDPAAEQIIATLLMDQGADVLMAHTNTTKPTEVAEARGGFAFGQASDMSAYGPTATLTATINNWGPYYVRRIEALVNGTWESKDTWGGFAEDMIALGDFSDQIDPGMVERALSVVEGMRDGTRSAFEGPVYRQDNLPFLEQGQVATDDDLHRMTYYVSGIRNSLPNNG